MVTITVRDVKFEKEITIATKTSIVCAVKRWWCHVPLLQCVLHKGNNGMLCLMSSDRMCYPRAMWECHDLRGRIVCVVQGDDNMQHTTSCDRVCYPRAMMACHARSHPIVCIFPGRWWHYHGRRHLTVCIAQCPWWHATPDVLWSRFAIQGRWWHGMPDVFLSCALSKGEYVMLRSTSSNRVCKTRGNI